MNASLQPSDHPLHSKYVEGDKLGAEITELCSYIYAATYQLLVKIREFDENEYWGVGGVCSCAHWLNFKCGIGMNAAREKVRVAHALTELPLISEAFRKGRVSYSKVRAMTRIADDTNEHESYSTRRADALAEIAETYMQTDPVPSSTADRYQVVVHVTAETSSSPEVENAHIEGGPHVTAETSRRIACDCTVVGVIDGEQGEPLSIGRRSRTIPPAMRRALRFRDKRCRFPGCTNTRFIDGHHIKHWADGGETSMDNLVQLCRRHHRLVHEGGFDCERRRDGKFVFRDVRSMPISHSVSLPEIDPRIDLYDWFERETRVTGIDSDTCIPNWYAGDTMDWDLAVGHLFPYQERPH